MAKKEARPVRSEEDMLAVAEELAARIPRISRRHLAPRLKNWLRIGAGALTGAGLTGLLWWAASS